MFAFWAEGAITCLPYGCKESITWTEGAITILTEGIDPLFALWTEGAITICLPSGEKEQRKEMQRGKR
jgi:hypothetical protein